MTDFKHCDDCPAKDECKAKGCYQEQLYMEEQAAFEQLEWEREEQRRIYESGEY